MFRPNLFKALSDVTPQKKHFHAKWKMSLSSFIEHSTPWSYTSRNVTCEQYLHYYPSFIFNKFMLILIQGIPTMECPQLNTLTLLYIHILQMIGYCVSIYLFLLNTNFPLNYKRISFSEQPKGIFSILKPCSVLCMPSIMMGLIHLSLYLHARW